MADSILFWNAVALEANRVSHSDPDKREQTGPTLSSRALAIVHLAMYDAYAGIVGGANFPRYLQPGPAPAGASARDAVAGAAYTTLTELFKAQKDYFDVQLDAFNPALNAAGMPTDASFNFGVAVGKALLALRANDPDDRDRGYKFSLDPGRHRPDPEHPGQGFHAPFYGMQAKCFAVTQRWALAPPPFKQGTGWDPEYEEAFRQVQRLGMKPELMGTLPAGSDRRTAEQTLIGIYWAYDGANRLGTPPRSSRTTTRVPTRVSSPSSTPRWATPESWPGSRSSATTSGGRSSASGSMIRPAGRRPRTLRRRIRFPRTPIHPGFRSGRRAPTRRRRTSRLPFRPTPRDMPPSAPPPSMSLAFSMAKGS
jgi:hypothetical protein